MASSANAAATAAAAASQETIMGAEKLEEPDHSSSNWYLPREYIDKNSPSRMDRIDLKKENYLRKSFCRFLQDLGTRLVVPQKTIAASIVLCHRFFLRQSHAKNDRYLIATSCMFLAGKVEEAPLKLCDVIYLSYEIRNKKDPTAVQRIKQKEVYDTQKELVLLGERLVLTTLGFDLKIDDPYKSLCSAIKKLKLAQNNLLRVAWNFVDDGFYTSQCLQFKPHHIAAGAIFLAAKLLKVKLPSEGEKVWWQELEVTPRQLEEISSQMLELYDHKPESTAFGATDPSTSMAKNNLNRAAGKAPASISAQFLDKTSPADLKGRGNEKRSAYKEGLPMSIEMPDDAAVEQKTRVGSSTKSDTHKIPDSMLVSEANGPTVLEEAEQSFNLPHLVQSKPEFVEMADINIDRVKAAMQRRKKGDKRPPVVKRELTDEEELLEMELENVQRDRQHEPLYEGAEKRNSHHMEREPSAFGSDMEAEELLQMSLEGGVGGKGKHHDREKIVKHEHEQRLGLHRQERDHKKPCLHHGK